MAILGLEHMNKMDVVMRLCSSLTVPLDFASEFGYCVSPSSAKSTESSE